MIDTNSKPIGIMQGRLLKPYEGRFQAFPATLWREEFPRAQEAGLSCIEWIYEEPHQDLNPLATDEGIASLRELSERYGVLVRSICADYTMTRRLVDSDGNDNADNVAHVHWLIGRAQMMGVVYIVLPFVDASSLRTPAERNGAVRVLRALAPRAEKCGVELHLETDLPPNDFVELLERVDHPKVKANYDIGNSSALGFDPNEELVKLAPWLGSVHVKDRVLHGVTVPLGTGNADLTTCFKLILEAGFDGHYILQVARSDEMSEVDWARQNVATVRRYLSQ